MKFILPAVAAVAVVAGTGYGVQQYQNWQHTRQGEAKLAACETQYQDEVNAALDKRAQGEATIEAQYDTALKSARMERNEMLASIHHDYPGIVIPASHE